MKEKVLYSLEQLEKIKIPYGKSEDITGKKFGNLTVLFRVDPPNISSTQKRKSFLACQCDCGNYVIARKDRMIEGNNNNCGCKNKNILRFEGKRFGQLVVLEQEKDKHVNRQKWWKCKCDCGKIISVNSNKLMAGQKSCYDCMIDKIFSPHKDGTLNNKKFGMLTALYENGRKGGLIMWHCKCDCGNECDVPGTRLVNGYVKSCGCVLSKGEKLLSEIFNDNNIKFEQQKTFDLCKFPETNKLARFDFYLPDYNVLIEYDGEQHFYYSKSGWNTKQNFEYTKKHDEYKSQWCKKNNIKLIRIPYWDFNIINTNYILNLLKEDKNVK